MLPIWTSRPLLAALVFIALPVSAHAQSMDDLDARRCSNGLFGADAPFQLAHIVGEERAYFLNDTGGCPKASDCRDPLSSYVVTGDKVVVSKLRNSHACAYFPNDVGGTAGYLPLSRLELLDVDTMPNSPAWLGRWSSGDNPMFDIAAQDDQLQIAGYAFWPGRPGTHDYPSTNIGEIAGPLTIFGNRARFDDGHCEVDFTLLEDIIVADDNMRCGGMNVTFTAVYQRGSE